MTLKSIPIRKIFVTIILVTMLLGIVEPISAQTTQPATPKTPLQQATDAVFDNPISGVVPDISGSKWLLGYNTSCSTWFSFFTNFGTCGGRGILVWASLTIIYFFGWLLGLAAVVFNAALDLTVVSFHSQILSYVGEAIKTVWKMFRDLGNIVIIGMFTFIAIQIILGMESFSARKRIAQILMVAVLINFSFLFTNLAIYASNFIAIQFYKAAQYGISTTSAPQNITTLGKYKTGIAGKLAEVLGVSGFSTTKDALWKATDEYDTGAAALVFSILTISIFIFTSFIFLYASLLLIARAILFIILLAGSSLAFAALLVPEKLIGGNWFEKWQGSLIRNAIFAPLFLILLWATMQFATALRQVGGVAPWSGLVVDPSNTGAILSLFIYFLIAGMLYATIRISSNFANKIGGFAMVSMLPAFGAGLLARMGGLAARQTVGRFSAVTSERLAESARYQKNVRGNTFLANQLDSLSQGIKKGALRDFNAANTRAFSDMTSRQAAQFGRTNIGGFVGGEKKAGAAANERAQRLALTDKEAETLRDKTVRAEAQKEEHNMKRLEEDHARTQKELATLTSNVAAMTNDKSTIEKEISALDKERRNLDTDQNVAGSPAALKRIEEIDRDIADKKGWLSSQAQKIEEANKRAGDLVIRSRDIRQNREALQGRIENAAQKILEPAGINVKGSLNKRDERARLIAPDVALNRLSNAPFVMAGLSTKETDRLARGMDEIVKELRGQTAVRDLAVHIKSLEDKTVYGQREQLKQTKESVKQQEKVSALIEHQTDTVENSNRNRPTT